MACPVRAGSSARTAREGAERRRPACICGHDPTSLQSNLTSALSAGPLRPAERRAERTSSCIGVGARRAVPCPRWLQRSNRARRDGAQASRLHLRARSPAPEQPYLRAERWSSPPGREEGGEESSYIGVGARRAVPGSRWLQRSNRARRDGAQASRLHLRHDPTAATSHLRQLRLVQLNPRLCRSQLRRRPHERARLRYREVRRDRRAVEPRLEEESLRIDDGRRCLRRDRWVEAGRSRGVGRRGGSARSGGRRRTVRERRRGRDPGRAAR